MRRWNFHSVSVPSGWSSPSSPLKVVIFLLVPPRRSGYHGPGMVRRQSPHVRISTEVLRYDPRSPYNHVLEYLIGGCWLNLRFQCRVDVVGSSPNDRAEAGVIALLQCVKLSLVAVSPRSRARGRSFDSRGARRMMINLVTEVHCTSRIQYLNHTSSWTLDTGNWKWTRYNQATGCHMFR